MGFSDIYSSAFKKRNQNHFASIVRVAMANGVIDDQEKLFLDRLARKLEIGEVKYEEILKNYNTHPINPPSSFERRLERLYDLARMVYADGMKRDSQVEILKKVTVGLGFNPENAKYVVDKALALVDNGVDVDDFIDGIKKMNQ